MPSELAFQAQLVSQDQRKLYEYWRRSAGPRLMPARRDIDPIAIPELLSGMSLMDVGDEVETLTYRVAGTRLHDIFGVEVTARRVFDLELGDKRHYWLTAYQRVIVQQTAMQGAVRGPFAGREHLILFWLRLPLSDDGRAVNKILCYDIALTAAVPRDGSFAGEICAGFPAKKL
jgi:hypothetical protein